MSEVLVRMSTETFGVGRGNKLKVADNSCLYPHCSMSFDTKISMLEHMCNSCHSANPPHVALRRRDRCPEGYKAGMESMNALGFATHLEYEHLWCVICALPCSNADELAEHVRFKHTILQWPSNCPSPGCNRSFESLRDLLMHYWHSNDHARAFYLGTAEKVESFAKWGCSFCGKLSGRLDLS